MQEESMARSSIQQAFVSTKVCEALTRANLPHNSAIRRVLEEESEVVGGRDAYVRCRGDVSLDERILEMREDPRFKNSFPAAKPVIAKSDTRSLTANFADIASGKVIVVD
jgi:hypothetical protein